ncbi:MAG: YadA-like family protein, partial [Megasphaera sp.]|nr:YadA-like family protein [Megasphaera sp.]
NVNGNTNVNGNITAKKATFGDTVILDASGINVSDTKIINVANGDVVDSSKEAVNGGQLYIEQKDRKDADTRLQNNIDSEAATREAADNSLSKKISDIDSRNKKGIAGVAALAALHPLDFDPDAKWDFAAGYGNYRGENAAAIGAYYRPNEDVMLSVGGTLGNGNENSINAGLSFKLGAGSSHVNNSKTAMAKEIKDLRAIVEKQDAQMQKMAAMFNAFTGMNAMDVDQTKMFPDVPANHWAYQAVQAMANTGLIEGYPDGEFKGDRTLTRYEFAQVIYRALQKGAEVDARLMKEFAPELKYFHIDTIAKDKAGTPTIERVRVNK